MPETIEDTIFTSILLTLFSCSTIYYTLAFRQCSRFTKWLHQHHHYEWIKFGAPSALFWKGEVRKNHRVTRRTHPNSFYRTFRNSLSTFREKFQEEEAQRILDDYQRYSRRGTFLLLGFVCTVFIAIIVTSP